jgi:isochorismate synthase
MATATKSFSAQTQLALQLSQLVQTGSRLLSYSQVVENIEPLSFFANGRHLTGTAFYWARPADNFVLVGVGAALTLRGTGATRFEQVAVAWRDLIQNFQSNSELQKWGVGPMLMGGFAFDPLQQPKHPQWQAFGDGTMILPQFQLAQLEGQTFLTCNYVLPTNYANLSTDEQQLLLEEYAENSLRLKLALSKPVKLTEQEAPTPPKLEDILPTNVWQQIVQKATRTIKTGQFEKTVLAREVVAHFEHSLELELILQRLQNKFPAATIFAMSQREQCFLGATPERLVQLNKGWVITAALAGSAPRHANPVEDARIGQTLLHSAKNLGEHAIVAKTITAQLEPICDPLNVPAAPQLLQLANVQHLYTPIEGRLRGEAGLLELVNTLHPTPALGGYPRQEALEFIRQNEQLDRGWYAAPVGWLNTRNEGEFVGAIRSALVSAKEAHLFAGCGIVSDSDPTSEYQESKVKLKAVASAICA